MFSLRVGTRGSSMGLHYGEGRVGKKTSTFIFCKIVLSPCKKKKKVIYVLTSNSLSVI